MVKSEKNKSSMKPLETEDQITKIKRKKFAPYFVKSKNEQVRANLTFQYTNTALMNILKKNLREKRAISSLKIVKIGP